jgi:hypothetical protein
MTIALALLPANQIYIGFVVLNTFLGFAVLQNVNVFYFPRQFNVKIVLLCNWSCRKRRKQCSGFINIGRAIGWQYKPQLGLAFVAKEIEPTMTWSHGTVGSMPAVMDIDKISGILFVKLHHINYISFANLI